MQLEYKYGTCEVHKYALHDTKPRKIFYCTTCKAWLCDDCDKDMALRFTAMAARALEKVLSKRIK